MNPGPSPPAERRPDASALAWLALLLFAVGIYTFGLGGQYIPSNGDEMVYSHIARLTAASDHWLPLVSALDNMRNTKPPLLFWQAMLAGDWGRNWSLAALRTPSLLYTLLTTGALAWSLQRITGNLRSACLAACLYLAFFCTFRYGRTYLTSAPETFWLSAPMFWLLWHSRPATTTVQADKTGWLAHAGFGVALGLGLAYKSFALIAPAAAALWIAELLSTSAPSWRTGLQTTLKVSLSAAVALGLFALWFALDPDPRAVWQEFVIGENAGKLSSDQGYWRVALFGGGVSMWAQLLAYVQNAGLLAFVVLGLFGLGLKLALSPKSSRGAWPAHVIILLTWLAVWLLLFTLPSQRSARYVIPAMPALAMLMALGWQRVGRIWFLMSLLLCAIFVAGLGRIAWTAHEIGIGTGIELCATLLTMAAGLLLVVGGLFKPAWTRACTVAACLAVYAAFGLATAPLNGASGHYASEVAAMLRRARIAVPNGFNGQFERFEFLLPGNQFIPYDSEERATSHANTAAVELSRLLDSHDAVIWLQSNSSELTPPCTPDCRVLGSRWEVKGRHQSGEIHGGNLWYPQRWLFRREWLLRSAAPPKDGAQH
jgi:4-amino-4-deoxy-L-arabinose transferase-like glycosyltransferase